jgi:hypothetical protein
MDNNANIRRKLVGKIPPNAGKGKPVGEASIPGKSWLKVRGEKIFGEDGKPVYLRGYCIGGWMNMENFINGFPGQEHAFRAELARVLGPGKAKFFFDQMLDEFLDDDDIWHMSSLGVNCLRVPVNYRHFEDDLKPFRYKKEGFSRLSRLIKMCSKHGIWVIIDLHSAQGWQNPDWHSDNPANIAHLWSQMVFQDRVTGLWMELARRYSDEPAVAGYNLLNEPVCTVAGEFNGFSSRLCAAIRKVDRRHLVFIEGNNFSTEFSELDPRMDHNAVFSSHNYAPPSFSTGPYPGRLTSYSRSKPGGYYDKQRLESEYLGMTSFNRRHGVPNWVGEFGSLYRGNSHDHDRLKVVEHQMDMFNRWGSHWTLWTYKDIGMMGTVTVREDSHWMSRTRKVRAIKDRFGVDTWGGRGSLGTRLVDSLMLQAERQARINGVQIDPVKLRWNAERAISGNVLANSILPAFAEQFRGMTEKEIAVMMKSFSWKNCERRAGLEDVMDKYCRG